MGGTGSSIAFPDGRGRDTPWSLRTRGHGGNARRTPPPDRDILPATLPALQARRLKPVSIALVVAAVVVLVFQFGLLGVARHLGLVPEAQRFTEMAFATPSRLPSTATPGTAVQLSFVITNQEGEKYTYRWDATLHEGTTATALASGQVTIAAAKSSQVPLVFVPKHALAAPAEISISLARPSEQLTVHLTGRAQGAK